MTTFFVTGTNTDIGKTVASAVILLRAQQTHRRISYHKPIQTGGMSDSDSRRVGELLNNPDIVSTGLCFKKPLSPHAAAYYDNSYVEKSKVLASISAHATAEINIIEGAGGLLVPINHHVFMIDIIKDAGLACIVVASSELSTINHTLLTLEALRARRMPIFGVIMMGKKNRDNENAIRSFGNIKNFLAFPHVFPLSHETLSAEVFARAAAIDQFLLGDKHA